jgi:hypothetical protein
MRNLNYLTQFMVCFHCEKPFTGVSPDNMECPYCQQTGAKNFGPLFSTTAKNLMLMFESVYGQKEAWKNHGVLITGMAVFEALLSEVFQSYMDSKKLPWILERPMIRHLPWQEKFDFLIEGAHLEEPSAKLKKRLKEIYDIKTEFFHGKGQSIHQSLYVEIYDMVGNLLQVFAEIYFQLNLKPFFYQQVREESRPLRRGSASHIAPPQK